MSVVHHGIPVIPMFSPAARISHAFKGGMYVSRPTRAPYRWEPAHAYLSKFIMFSCPALFIPSKCPGVHKGHMFPIVHLGQDGTCINQNRNMCIPVQPSSSQKIFIPYRNSSFLSCPTHILLQQDL